MHTFTPKHGATEQTAFPSSHLQRTIGNPALQRVSQTPTEKPMTGWTDVASPCCGHDLTRIPIHHGAAGPLQAKLAVNKPGDPYEQEADHVSERVMRMKAPDVAHSAPPAIQRLSVETYGSRAAMPVQPRCAECEDEMLHRKSASTVARFGTGPALHQAEAKVDAVAGGKPLTSEQRAFFEPRFGADFSHVRIHTDRTADSASRAVGALAYTRGSDIVFRGDQYRPHTSEGQQLLAHELTHVLQQGAAPRTRSGFAAGEQRMPGSDLHTRTAYPLVQRVPGDGMTPPGDCSWARYLVLRGAVESAKAVVSSLGACSAGDGCLLLATKIAAITAEIAARVALDSTCFRGGDTGHRQQVQDKVNMMNRCFRFFTNLNCPPELVSAMAVAVEAARAVITVGAAALALAVIVALIVAIIALVKAILAAVAAAAAVAGKGAAIGAAAAAVIALLIVVKDQIAPDESTEA